jgi:tetrapyrrole methylase family protein/MazG family protein
LRALDVLGLQGAHQVHVAPTLLRPDLRAHQVFVGFSSAEVVHGALRRLVAEAPAWVVRGSTVSALDLGQLCDCALAPEDVVVVPAVESENPGGLYGVVWLVDRLLGPGGCPWDQEQTHDSLKRHLIEEAYELCQAIDDRDQTKMREELGDVLLQPVMHAQMQRRDGGFDIDEVAGALVDKLVRRHPHVFAPGSGTVTSDQVLANWDEIKRREKGEPDSVLAGVPRAMPSLLRAFEVSKRAARSGFEWEREEHVWHKLEEEVGEFKAAATRDEREAELGDVLFTIVNIARWNGLEPEQALSKMLDRFTRRFQSMERRAEKALRDLDPHEWDELWERVKMEQP